MNTEYEVQDFSNEKFPLRYHTDRVYGPGSETHSYSNIKGNRFGEIQIHWHEWLEVWRIISGKPAIVLDTVQFSAEAGDIVVINTSQLHTIKVAEGECVYEVLGIDHLFCKDFGFDLQHFNYQTIIRDKQLSAIFDKITDEYYSQKPFYEAIILSSCMEMLGILSRWYTTDKKVIDDTLLKKTDIVRQMTQYISDNYSSQDILADLSEYLNYSKSHLSHIFISTIGISVKEYLLRTRFHYAKKMLGREKLSVFETAKKCGYNNAASFSTAFKKRIGITPAEYVRQINYENVDNI